MIRRFERRRFTRTESSIRATIVVEEGALIFITLLDRSAGGLCIRCPIGFQTFVGDCFQIAVAPWGTRDARIVGVSGERLHLAFKYPPLRAVV